MKNWSWLETAAHILPLEDRDAVIGDLVEAQASPRQILIEVLGLIVRREIALWKNWRPWAAAFGLALPSSFLLMGLSVSVLTACQPIQLESDSRLNLLANVVLLLASSWAAGFGLVSLSRRTLGTSVIACLLPCLFCLARFRTEGLSRFSLFPFILPVALGIRQGIRYRRIRPSVALLLAVAVTLLTLCGQNDEFFWFHAALLWPTWYIVATAARPATHREGRRTS